MNRLTSTLLVGVGNEYANDDALGVLVVREIHRRCPTGVAVLELNGEATGLISAWKGSERVGIVDAIEGKTPGRIHRLDASSAPLPRGLFHASSHTLGVAEAVELSRSLGTLPHTVIVYGIEGAAFDPGVGLSDPVLWSIPALITMIEHEMLPQKMLHP